MKPAMMALVVAIAGMIEPAIDLTFQRDVSSMWKQAARRFVPALRFLPAYGRV